MSPLPCVIKFVLHYCFKINVVGHLKILSVLNFLYYEQQITLIFSSLINKSMRYYKIPYSDYKFLNAKKKREKNRYLQIGKMYPASLIMNLHIYITFKSSIV